MGKEPLASIETKATISGKEAVVRLSLLPDFRLAVDGRPARRLGQSGGNIRVTADGEHIISVAADVVDVLNRQAFEAAQKRGA